VAQHETLKDAITMVSERESVTTLPVHGIESAGGRGLACTPRRSDSSKKKEEARVVQSHVAPLPIIL
jgi:hypothetical protein